MTEVYRSSHQLPILLATSGSWYDKKRLSRVSRVEICSISSARSSNSKMSMFSAIEASTSLLNMLPRPSANDAHD